MILKSEHIPLLKKRNKKISKQIIKKCVRLFKNQLYPPWYQMFYSKKYIYHKQRALKNEIACLSAKSHKLEYWINNLEYEDIDVKQEELRELGIKLNGQYYISRH